MSRAVTVCSPGGVSVTPARATGVHLLSLVSGGLQGGAEGTAPPPPAQEQAGIVAGDLRSKLVQWWQCDYDRLDPPGAEYIEVDGTIAITVVDDPAWHWVGYIPTPRGRLAWFVYHLAHGLAMGYPALKALLYAACNTRPGSDLGYLG